MLRCQGGAWPLHPLVLAVRRIGMIQLTYMLISGILWCITIIGIPYGKQCFKFASLSFAPFGKDIEYGGGVPSLFANIIWIIFFGIPMAIENLVLGCLWCITIVGIPFGLQFFKIAKVILSTFWSKSYLSYYLMLCDFHEGVVTPLFFYEDYVKIC